MAVAILMAWVQKAHRKPYWIQGVPDVEQSPDVRTICREDQKNGMAPWCYQQDVEVVSYTNYSATHSLADFVAATKFAQDTAYDNQTTILVNVKANARLPSADEWSSVLSSTGKRNPVIILGKVDLENSIYRAAVVHPIAEGAVDYSPYELLKRQGYTGVVKWERGTVDRQISYPHETHCPFEEFGVMCKLLGRPSAAD